MVAPDHLAPHAGREVLHESGNAIESTVAATADMAVVCPPPSFCCKKGFFARTNKTLP